MRSMIILLLSVTSILSNAAEITFPKRLLELTTVKGNKYTFSVELAVTAPQRQQGLMYRENIPDGTGMLFDYKTARLIAMWMKNTPTSLDMLFADENGRIFQIVEQATPYSLEHIRSNRAARYVLELPGGTAQRKGITSGAEIIVLHIDSAD